MVMRSKRIYFQKLLLLGAAVLFFVCIGGCQGPDGSIVLFATPTPSPTPTPTPVPTPVPVVALLGAEDLPEYAKRVEHAVTQAGLKFEAIPGGAEALADFSPKGAGSAILYCPGELPDLTTLDVRHPVFFFLTSQQNVPQGVSNLSYDGDMAPVEALQLALDYPPHLAPVRMLGLFTSNDSPAAQIWNKAVSDGLIMNRGTFVVAEETDSKDKEKAPDLSAQVNDWLNASLKRLYPGMLDCIYVETGALAVAVTDAMLAIGRTDAEIFAAGTQGDVCAYLDQYPALLARAVGMDVDEAARISVESAIALISDPQTAIQRSLSPQVYPVKTAEP